MSDRLNTSYSGSMYNSEMRPLDYLYGPWNSIDELLQELHVTVEEIEPGLTIGVIEDGKVVEYWNPTSEGFVKKRMGGMSGSFPTYEDALEHATSDNLGSLFLVEGENGGLYMVTGEGELEPMEYGEFPEGEDMNEHQILPVNKDGMVKVSDVYRRMKKIQLETNRKLHHTHKFAHDIISDLDKYDEHDDDKTDDHMFIQRLENTQGKITIKREPLDTDRVVMNGDYIKGVDGANEDDVFITVRGTEVGNYTPGEEILSSTPLDVVLRNMLEKDLKPTDEPILPTLTLNIEPNEKTYEVGSNPEITLSSTFNDGKISTFKDEKSLKSEYVDAGCVAQEDTLKYSVKKPDSDEFEDIEDVFKEIMTEGKYIFKSEMNYSGNTVKPKDNKGEELVDDEYNISAGVATSEEKESTVHLKYKMWCLMTDEYLAVDNSDSHMFNIENYEAGETWFDGESVLINSITLKNKYIYVICPIEYKVVFDTQIAKNIDASKGVTYNHTLPNGETKQYRLWFMLNDGYYENVRFEKDGDYDSEKVYMDSVEGNVNYMSKQYDYTCNYQVSFNVDGTVNFMCDVDWKNDEKPDGLENFCNIQIDGDEWYNTKPQGISFDLDKKYSEGDVIRFTIEIPYIAGNKVVITFEYTVGSKNADVDEPEEPTPPDVEIPESGTVLWGDFFGNGDGISSSSTFVNMQLVEEYQKEDMRLYKLDDKDSIRYTADVDNNVRLSKSTAGNMSAAHIWFNKSKDGVFTVYGIKLYGVTELTLTYKQTKGETYTYYQLNGTGVENPIGHNKLTAAAVTTGNITVPEGTETISIIIKHPSTNGDNTRVDDIELKVK